LWILKNKVTYSSELTVYKLLIHPHTMPIHNSRRISTNVFFLTLNSFCLLPVSQNEYLKLSLCNCDITAVSNAVSFLVNQSPLFRQDCHTPNVLRKAKYLYVRPYEFEETMLVWAHQFPGEKRSFLKSRVLRHKIPRRRINVTACSLSTDILRYSLNSTRFPSQNFYPEKLSSTSPCNTSYVRRPVSHSTARKKPKYIFRILRAQLG
jgi:hypothetical protein